METSDAGALLAWFLNVVGAALLAGMAAAAVLAIIGLAADEDVVVWLAFVAGPVATGLMLLVAKAPSARRLSETQAPTR